MGSAKTAGYCRTAGHACPCLAAMWLDAFRALTRRVPVTSSASIARSVRLS